VLRQDRLQAVEERLRLRNLAGWILVPGPNLLYLTGWRAMQSERVVLAVFPRGGDPFLFVPHLEAEAAREATGIARVLTYRDESGPEPALARALSAWALSNPVLGAEFAAMRLLERAAVNGVCPKARWADIGDDLAWVRQEKDAEEIANLRRAAEIATAAVEAGRRVLRPGVSEAEVRRACARALLDADSFSPFGVMVASGPRSALPHAPDGDREIREGDLCWIDLGASWGGYCADITRTFAVGAPDPRLAEAYRAVAEAQQAARSAARPGVAAEDLDHAARRVIGERGFGEYFPHRTGHGLGLEDHERPFIVDGNADPLRPGMVFTVEPGVYLPGRGGVRIEDDLVVTPEGCRTLTDYPRDWLAAAP
jgi:Xaa-Pro dipeptidase